VEERGLRGNSFNLRVGAVEEEDHRLGTRVRLRIPGRGRFNHVIFNERFERFLSLVARNRNHIRSYQINTHEAELTIKYDPTQRFASCGTDRNLNPDYVQRYPLTQNTLYSALERKADQLKKTNFNGPLGIIVCDSDNSLLTKVSFEGLSRTTDEIVKSFLKEEQAISFVILVGVHNLWADDIDIPHWAGEQARYEVVFYLTKCHWRDLS